MIKIEIKNIPNLDHDLDLNLTQRSNLAYRIVNKSTFSIKTKGEQSNKRQILQYSWTK